MPRSYRDGPTTDEMIAGTIRLASGTDNSVRAAERHITDHRARLDQIEKRLGIGGEKENPFRSFGDFLVSVRRAGMGGQADPRLIESRASGLNGAGAPDEGGFILPDGYSQALTEMVQYSAPIASRCMRIPATRRTLSMPAIDETSRANGSRFGGVVSGWGDEGVAITTGKPKFRSADFTLNKWSAAIYASEELVEDGAALGTFVSKAFTAEAGFVLDDMVLNGSGVGQPLGIVNAPGCVVQAKESGQTAGTIVVQNVTNAFSRMLPECRANAVWLVSPEIEESLYVAPLVVSAAGSSNNLFTPADASAPFGRLMSRPIVPVEQCAAIGTPGDIAFVDLSKYAIYERPADIRLSMHIRFVNGEGLFRITYRMDGQPIVKSAITSKNGGPTKSAFVTVAAR